MVIDVGVGVVVTGRRSEERADSAQSGNVSEANCTIQSLILKMFQDNRSLSVPWPPPSRPPTASSSGPPPGADPRWRWRSCRL